VLRQCRFGKLELDTRVRTAVPPAPCRFATKAEARRQVARFIDRYNTTRRHSCCEMRSPVDYEQILAARAAKEEKAA